jgi:hypothetical protein
MASVWHTEGNDCCLFKGIWIISGVAVLGLESVQHSINARHLESQLSHYPFCEKVLARKKKTILRFFFNF